MPFPMNPNPLKGSDTMKSLQRTSRQRGEVIRDENMTVSMGDKVTLYNVDKKEKRSHYVVAFIPGLHRYCLISTEGSTFHVPLKRECKSNAFNIPLAVLLGPGLALKQSYFKELDKRQYVEFKVKGKSLGIEQIFVSKRIW